ncbi:hypothetical protein BT69DRAFT_1331615 [Atractiella rhizophila]|nr:hypothetical protein BT69DRAFT_1331615 [Atractiella rhizophila]
MFRGTFRMDNYYFLSGILFISQFTTKSLLGLYPGKCPLQCCFYADFGAQGVWKRIQKAPILVQIAIQVIFLAIAGITQFAGPIRNNINSGLAKINVQDHPEITFADCIFVACILFVVESSKPLQFVFGNIVMRTLGRLAAGIYLLCVPLLFTIIPDLALNLHNNGSSGASILGITYLVLFAASVGLAVPFHFLVELPSKLAGEWFGNFVEEWGLDAEEKKRIRKTLVRPKKELTKKPPAAAGAGKSTVLS